MGVIFFNCFAAIYLFRSGATVYLFSVLSVKKFLIRTLIFLVLCFSGGEVIIRAFRLTTEIPELRVDEYGIQRYKPGQTGYYSKSSFAWKVNSHGWLGIADTLPDTVISIIGDSYIENIMNPIECNQASFLKKLTGNYGFYEAGRSGVSFIEAMELTKVLDIEIKPLKHLVYINNGDFYETIGVKGKKSKRVTIDLTDNTIFKPKVENALLKKVIYSSKFMFYMRLRFFSKEKNGDENKGNQTKKSFDYDKFRSLFAYCLKTYDTDRIVFIYHPNIEKGFVELTKEFGFKYIVLDTQGHDWAIDETEPHWSCFGHEEVAKQVARVIRN